MSVSAIIVTRGNVDLAPIWASIPVEWERVVWDNRGLVSVQDKHGTSHLRDVNAPDLSVYGRYAAIEYASHECIYVQDDDCIVSDPQRIADRFRRDYWGLVDDDEEDVFLVANMPQEFRPNYPDSCLVGFGACFHRDLPAKAFERFAYPSTVDWEGWWTGGTGDQPINSVMLRRTCDVVFTTLTPRVLVDVPVERLDYAFGEDRMYNQPGHVEERTRVLEMARRVRDAD